MQMQATTEEEQEDRRGRTLCVFQVAAVSGFVEDNREMQTSCLSLCNTCREGVPLPLLRIKPGMPSGLLRLLSSDMHRAEGGPVSRVLSHRRVMCVELTFLHFGSDEDDGGAGQQEEDGCLTGAVVGINTVTWPEGTRSILLHYFNRPVQEVVWPANLKRLAFGRGTCEKIRRSSMLRDVFNQSLDGVHFPSGVREIYLGEAFNQPIDNVAWPEGLEKLSLPRFNRPIDQVRWPAGLKVLEFMSSWQVAETVEMKPRCFAGLQEGHLKSFNQPISVGLPASLHTLWLSDEFDQPIDTVVWPTGLATLGFGENFSFFLTGVVWPSTLRRVFFVHRPPDYEDGDFPDDCSVFIGMEPDSDADEMFQADLDMDTWNAEDEDDIYHDIDGVHWFDREDDNFSDFSM